MPPGVWIFCIPSLRQRAACNFGGYSLPTLAELVRLTEVGHHGHILVVDDDPGIRETLGDVLRDEGYDVELVENGRVALESLRQTAPPCLILLVLMMPVMNGWEFSNELERDPALAHIPIVVITAQRGLSPPPSQAREILPKPVQLDQLLESIDKLC